MNKLALLALSILLICGGALWFLASGSLNDYIKVQIEHIGQEITEQKVSVAKVEMKLVNGAGTIKGVKLNNPAQYNYPHVFTLGTVTLDINLKSLTSEPIIIDEIIIDKPQAFVEFTKDGKSNIKDLLDIIKKNTQTAEETPSSDTPQKGPKIRISKLTLSGVALSLDLSNLGNKEHKMTLPSITLLNIGGDAGLPSSELGVQIISQVLKAISKEATQSQKKLIKDKVKDKLEEKIGKKLTDLFG